jgi:hypothetical protein
VVERLRALAPGDTLSVHDLGAQIKPGFAPQDLSWLENIVAALERDGLLAVERPPDRERADVGEWRVRLP